MPQRNCDAKDEMNLAEFPLCSLAHRLNPEVKTLRFEDRIWDKGRNQFIVRRLTITGSDVYGLPREKDDEVLLGLIQLTRAHGFADRKVPFTRSELIRVLGWRDDSKSYARIKESLNRWTGVTLYYDNAWWNKDRKSWMKEAFHFLDNVWLCHRGEPPPDTGLPITGMPQSAFVWNETVFRSFTHGNLKSIDFEFFKSLKSAVAKRLYRFLDKHFYKRSTFEMGLRELCCEHIGLSRNYDTANLKRKLMTGIRELEERGFLRTICRNEQFQKVRAGEWRVIFQRSVTPEPQKAAVVVTYADPLAEALIERGVQADVAKSLVSMHSAVHVQQKIAFTDELLAKGVSALRNPAGFLISCIRRPRKHTSKGTSAQKQNPRKESDAQNAISQRENSNRVAQEEAAEEFWQSLSTEEQVRLEKAAMAQANAVELDLLQRGGAFSGAARQSIRTKFALKLGLNKDSL